MRDIKETGVVDGLVDDGHAMLKKASSYEERFHDGIAENLSVSNVSASLSLFQSGEKFKKVWRDSVTMKQISHFLVIYLFLKGVDAIHSLTEHLQKDLNKHRR